MGTLKMPVPDPPRPLSPQCGSLCGLFLKPQKKNVYRCLKNKKFENERNAGSRTNFRTTLIERNHPTRGGWVLSIIFCCKQTLVEIPLGVFLFTMFPHQEPCVIGPPSKDLYQVLRGGSSSYTRFLITEHSK